MGDNNETRAVVFPAGETVQDQYREAFTAACKLVWDPKKLNLTYLQPPAIPETPTETGLRLVKKEPGQVFPDRIGRFFKTYNFIQYKRDGALEESDLFRDYACILAYEVQHEDTILNNCTLTIVCPTKPDKVLTYLEGEDVTVWQEDDPDIWYADLGFCIKMQIVVSEELVQGNNE